ncbi:MAG: glucose-1-phosphate cytidylyltransferase [Paracoccaceae bacterium]|nr:glucose-1-phosphate cytidylyltransferase [Paracoccaceae bacterium]MDG2258387.1 glucose-1-phosphate cytidylyltransferase [Paracoccaceae bacterium]
MKVIILAGGFGTRLSEYTDVIPKPMVTIGGRPILWHIMNSFANHGHKDFHVALGYKASLIKEYFLNYRSLNADFTVDLGNGKIEPHQINEVDWNVTLVDTGLASMTGGRVKRMEPFIGNEPFLLTYGDGVSDVDISALVKFHKSHGKMVTVTAVHPNARFGELDIQEGLVKAFKEKPQTEQGWINGGYFVVEPSFFDFIAGDDTILEREPLEKVAEAGELMAFQHEGFWQCMDTKRDRDHLEELWASGNASWRC